MTESAIPIENVYYLLSYAWDRLDEAKMTRVATEPGMAVMDFIARVLSASVTHLLKRGIDRSYLSHTEEIAGVRGRLDVTASVKALSFPRARAHCKFDELSADVLHNQIVKTTLRRLARVSGLARSNSTSLRQLYRRLPEVSEIDITASTFRRVVLGRNNAYYRFVLDICDLVHRNLLPNEHTGRVAFRDFTRDDREMARLFERFLFHFYRIEQANYKVSAPRFPWRATGSARDLPFIPEMKTDVVLRSTKRTVVIDAKYYAKTLSDYFTRSTVRPGHLYQLYAYLNHLPDRVRRPEVRGLLIYPRTSKSVRVEFKTDDYSISAMTVNLNQSWPGVRQELLAAIGEDY